MPLFKPEVNTSPFGAALLLVALTAILLGALVLPGVIYILAWIAVIALCVLVAFYIGQRLHRRFLGVGGRRR